MDRNNFKKKNISDYLCKKKGYSALFAKKIINDLIEILSNEISKDNFTLKNIGTFKILNKKTRIGRNPKTKEIYFIKARKSLVFKPSLNLSKKINKYIEKTN